MTLKQDLIATKALIDTPEKWLQGSSSLPMPSGVIARCLSAAMNIACPTHVEYYPVAAALRDAIPEDTLHNMPRPEVMFTQWNDHPRRTHAQVMQVLDIAIERAE